jgi:hypothetical protein
MLFKKYSGFIPNITHQDGTAFMGKLYKDGHFSDSVRRSQKKDSEQSPKSFKIGSGDRI